MLRFLLWCGLFIPTVLLAENWESIAHQTDEPAVGLKIVKVFPGFYSDELGLKPGDYITQVGDQLFRIFRGRNVPQEEMLFFVRAGGRKESHIVPAGETGFRSTFVFRPWLSFLRGEIGVSNVLWNDDVVSALEAMHERPDEAIGFFKSAKRKGYPADELQEFIRAYVGWRKGEPISVREAFVSIYKEFEVLPPVYSTRLEDLAFFSHETDVLRKLKEIDPGGSLVSEEYLEVWDQLRSKERPPINLLEEAERLRGRDYIDSVEAPEGTERDYLPYFLAKRLLSASPGKYNSPKFVVPGELQDFHFSLTGFCACRGYDPRWASANRVVVRDGERPDGSIPAGNTYIDIGYSDSSYCGKHVLAKGGHVRKTRAYSEPSLNIPLLDEDNNMLREPIPGREPPRIDVIKIGGEIAGYVDGICYLHLPVDPDPKNLEIMVHVCGMNLKVRDVHLWSLD